MSDPLDAYGDTLRRALHAEVQYAWPARDGLDRIHARTTSGWLGHSRGHDLVAVLTLLLILLFPLGGS